MLKQEANATTTSLFAILFFKFFELERDKDQLVLKNLLDFSWSQFSYPNHLRLCFNENDQPSWMNASYLNSFFHNSKFIIIKS